MKEGDDRFLPVAKESQQDEIVTAEWEMRKSEWGNEWGNEWGGDGLIYLKYRQKKLNVHIVFIKCQIKIYIFR